jgi:DNA-binding NarL/FixJ family response regulator
MSQVAAEVSILIAEDDPLLRHFLLEVLADREGIRVVGTAGTGREALRAASELTPQVMLLDLGLPEMSGLEVLDGLSEMRDPPQVLVLSGDESEETQLAAARRGARGFLGKTQARGTLAEVIRTVAAGEVWLPPQVVGRLLADYSTLVRRTQEQQRPINRLTEKEREVLVRVAQGMTNQQIAQDLFMSLATVKLHNRNLFRKLDLANRAEAAAFAVREGLLEAGSRP